MKKQRSFTHFVKNSVQENRIACGWSKNELSQKVKCSASMISRIEGGSACPGVAIAKQLSRVFQKPLDQLFHLELPKYNP